MTVTSDPVLADADGDSLADATEKLLGMNPNAWDTDGDGNKDAIFVDLDGSVFEGDIEWLALSGITKGCNPPVNNMFCPNDYVTRGQMAAFLVRALHLTDQLDDPFTDDDGWLAAMNADSGLGGRNGGGEVSHTAPPGRLDSG